MSNSVKISNTQNIGHSVSNVIYWIPGVQYHFSKDVMQHLHVQIMRC